MVGTVEIHTRRFNPFFTSSIFRFDPPSFDTYTPVTLLGSPKFHGESLDQKQEPDFLRVNHTDSLVLSFDGATMSRGLCCVLVGSDLYMTG
jgi:hypothetical protein